VDERVFINGEAQPYAAQTVRELLQARGADPDLAGIAVAVNGKVVPRGGWADHQLAPDDRIEIIRAIAGG